MAEYFNQTDLDARRQKTACWIHEEATKIANNLKYSGKIDNCRLSNLSYVVAALEAVECYVPITTAAQDGEDNCLTEALAESLFNNISKITKICFVPKNATYTALEDDDNNQFNTMTLVGGGSINTATGLPIKSRYTVTEYSKL
jgi:hypothetical protein